VWLLATVVMTTIVGAEHYAAFISAFGQRSVPENLSLLLRGLWYSGTVIAILGAHEMGHYVMCRVHRVDATLPYFIPAPLLFGTLGAVIKIREPFRSKRALFDIGIGGPIAGFVILVPALFVGIAMSTVERLPDSFEGAWLGEPLLFRFASWMVWGSIPEDYSLNLHPMGLAAWLGLLATALNLIPFGQLDGGHISYAVLGPKAARISLVSVVSVVGMTLASWSWLFFALLLIAMFFMMGPRHPPVPDEDIPLDPGRRSLAIAAAIIFALCFTPAPIEPYQLIGNP
jgi:membrane-associated protease RseP (regulator of RpoE activity)